MSPEVDTCLRALTVNPSLGGILLADRPGADLVSVIQRAREIWGNDAVSIVPHSAHTDSIGRSVLLSGSERRTQRTCFILPNVHFAADDLLQAVFRGLEATGGVFIASFHPDEPRPAPMALDRAAACPNASPGADARRRFRDGLRPLPVAAQEAIPVRAVEVAPSDLSTLTRAAEAAGATGHRTQILAAELARTLAALSGSHKVRPLDLQTAIEWSLSWRKPSGKGEAAKTPGAQAVDGKGGDRGRHPQGRGDAPLGAGGPPERGSSTPGEFQSDGRRPAGQTGAKDAGSSARAQRFDPAGPAPSPVGTDTVPTGIAQVALPPGWQLTRGGRKDPAPVAWNRGRRPFGRPPRAVSFRGVAGAGKSPGRQTQTRLKDSVIDWHATLLASLPHRERRRLDARAPVQPEDLRYRTRVRPLDRLMVAILDTSASMLIHRIEKAKGLLAASLSRAFCDRSAAGLILCGGDRAQTAVSPTQSPTRIAQAIAAARIGGGTPLEDALIHAHRMARSFLRRHGGRIQVLIFTDGGANVASSESEGATGKDVEAGLRQSAEALHTIEASLLVVDARGPYGGGGRGQALADIIGAGYVPLNRLEPT